MRYLKLFLLLCFISGAFSCNKSPKTKWIEVSSDFIPYIQAFTGGAISTTSTIKIQLTQASKLPIVIGELIDNSLFNFKPEINGKLKWIDQETVEFVPNDYLEMGKIYEAGFKLSEVADVPSNMKDFKFSFKTIKQSARMHLEFLQTSLADPNVQYINGLIETADFADASALANSLKASQNGNDLEIEWSKSIRPKQYEFQIKDIQRGNSQSKVKIEFLGDELGFKDKIEEEIDIPAQGEFFIHDMRMMPGSEPAMEIHFSDPLKPNQLLQGLVKVYGLDKPDAVADGQVLRVFLPSPGNGSYTIECFPGIENKQGEKLKKGKKFQSAESIQTPDVRFPGDGNILPQASGLKIPFEAIHLKKVDVKIIRILENNVPRFFSRNELRGSTEIKQTGKIVALTTIDLDLPPLNERNSYAGYTLDLNEIVKTQPGAIYRAELSYKPDYVELSCLDVADKLEQLKPKPDFRKLNQASYYGYDDWYEEDYYYDNNYDWRERNNPCDLSFYRYGRSAVSNFIATRIGLMAKEGKDDTWHFYATDLITGQPLPGVNFEIFDYQLQSIAKLIGDKNGHSILKGKLEDTPFLLAASQGNQKNYLKMNRGDLRPIGSFDVSGNALEEGLKGFLYTERGVWRPGDTVFLNAIIEKQFESKNQPPFVLNVYNPRGQRIHREVKPYKNDQSLYDFQFKTQGEGVTGSYRAVLEMGSASFVKYLRVETIQPNRLKMKLTFPSDVVRNSEVPINLLANWLHGSPASGLRADVKAVLRQANTSFKGYEDYSFEDKTLNFNSEELTLFDGALDETGAAKFYPLINSGTSFPGKLNADFTVRVFEPGGQFSIDRFSKQWLPYSTFVGVKAPEGYAYNGALEIDKEHTLSCLAVSDLGKPLSNRNLRVSIYKLETQWWWQRSSIRINDYYRSGYTKAFSEEVVNTNANGKASVDVKFGDDDFGAYLVRVCDLDGNHCATEVLSVSTGSFKPEEYEEIKNSRELALSADKDEYSVGDEVILSFPSPAKGKAHISIEDGIGVIDQFWINTEIGETKFSLKTDHQYAPNVYAHVTIFQPHERDNDLPLRMYGILRLVVNDESTKLNPQVDCPKSFTPEAVTELKVTEKDGKAMEYTLAIVDEGLLDLTRFETPDPWKAMNAIEALGTKTWDLYDDVIGKYSGTIESEIRIGGGGAALEKDGNTKANRFIPMVRFLGPFNLKAGEKASHKVDIPAYYGSVRVMLVASSRENAWGMDQKTAEVKKPLMILSTLPRVLSPQEEISLPIQVFALDKSIKSVNLTLESNAFLEPVSSRTQTIKFSETGDQLAIFKVRVINKTGIGKVTVKAASGNYSAITSTEIDVRSPNPIITKSIDFALSGGENWESDLAYFGMEGTGSASIELSGMPSINLTKRLNYLISYPHGCVEQVTSAAFPQLYLDRLVDIPEKQQKDMTIHIKMAIKRLSLYQNATGGFSYWPGNYSSDDWSCSYVGHFLLEAKLAGYSVSSDILNSWKRYQTKKVNLWNPRPKDKVKTDGYLQAYRLYTLALAGKTKHGAMNRLKEYPYLSRQAAVMLAAAYAQSGQKEVALGLLNKSDNYEYSTYSHVRSYGSSSRDLAIQLWVMSKFDLRKQAINSARELANSLGSGQWMNTQATSWGLMAMAHFYKNRDAQRIDANLNVGGKSERIFTNKSIIKKEIPQKYGENQTIKVDNPNEVELFGRLIRKGVPGTDQLIEAYERGLSFRVKFSSLSGVPMNIAKIKQGTDIQIDVMVSNPVTGKNLSDVALRMMMPSGWEIENNRVSGMQASTSSSSFQYQDIRDDRVSTFFGINKGQTKSFSFRVNAAYLGKFYMPVWTCESMYDNEYASGTSSKWIEIVNTNVDEDEFTQK